MCEKTPCFQHTVRSAETGTLTVVQNGVVRGVVMNFTFTRKTKKGGFNAAAVEFGAHEACSSVEESDINFICDF